MNWYNYLFAALAVMGMFGCLLYGLPNSASRGNTAGVIYGLVIMALWAGVFYWNVFAA